MYRFMCKKMKWKTCVLHDTVLIAGSSVPTPQSLVQYFGLLHQFYGDDQTGFLPQSLNTHKKKTL